LVPMEHIADISSRLGVNKASMKMKHARIQKFISDIRGAIKEQ
jgi:ATP phosphoribosyltransferase